MRHPSHLHWPKDQPYSLGLRILNEGARLKTSLKTLLSAATLATVAIAGVFALGFNSNQSSHGGTLYRISREEYKAHIDQIHAMGLDVAGMNVANGTVDIIVRNNTGGGLEGLKLQSLKTLAVANRAPDAKFKTADQIAKILADYAARYPNLATVQSIGKSLLGKDIYAIRLTHGAVANKPAALFNGMHHAREVMSPEVPLDIIQTLLTGYGTDPKITHWLDTSVVYVLPMLNVDGNDIVWKTESMWRKNARQPSGVDINRNYPYAWNTCNGSSSNPGADDFHGAGPASEPETVVMMNFVASIHPIFDVSFHSYSEIVIYPYGCGGHTETANIVEPLAKQLASLIPTDEGTGTYTPGLAPELLYSVDGGDIDWMYHEQHVIAYVIELNSDNQGFQPDYAQWRDKTVLKLRPAWQLLLDRLGHSGVQATFAAPMMPTMAALHSHIGNVQVTDSHGFSEIYPIHADGSFHAVLNPGRYTVRYQTALEHGSKVVTVGDSMVNLKIAN
jgi:carboxypeptidase T